MSEKELREIKIIDLEIQRIEERLNKSQNHTSLENHYIEILQEKENELLQKKIEAEKYVQNIDNAEIRLILTLKFIDLHSWRYISKQLHYDRSTLIKKVKKFLANS